MTAKKGLESALGANIFDYGQKNSADMLRSSWEKLVLFVGNKYGQDIGNEIKNLVPVERVSLNRHTDLRRRKETSQGSDVKRRSGKPSDCA